MNTQRMKVGVLTIATLMSLISLDSIRSASAYSEASSEAGSEAGSEATRWVGGRRGRRGYYRQMLQQERQQQMQQQRLQQRQGQQRQRMGNQANGTRAAGARSPHVVIRSYGRNRSKNNQSQPPTQTQQ